MAESCGAGILPARLIQIKCSIDNFFNLIVTDFGLYPYPEHIPSITRHFVAYTYIIINNLYKILFSWCALSLLFPLSQRMNELTINHN